MLPVVEFLTGDIRLGLLELSLEICSLGGMRIQRRPKTRFMITLSMAQAKGCISTGLLLYEFYWIESLDVMMIATIATITGSIMYCNVRCIEKGRIGYSNLGPYIICW